MVAVNVVTVEEEISVGVASILKKVTSAEISSSKQVLKDTWPMLFFI